MIREGWAIAEYYKNGKFKGFHEPSYDENHNVHGITGWGKMYYSKSSCQNDVDILNRLWKEDIFYCVKVKMEIIEGGPKDKGKWLRE